MLISSGHVLQIKQLFMRYPTSANWVLDGLNLSVAQGESLALVGPSGCGKSTIARVALQLLPSGSICQGQLLLTGQDPRLLSQSSLRELRAHSVGLVFQDPMTRLNPLMTIGGHLLDMFQAHRQDKNAFWRRKRAEELLERVGICAQRFEAYPHELSGGMRQRLAIALAIALNPSLVIADEPTTSLDVEVACQVMGELKSLCSDLGSALLLISHDLAMASYWCEHMAIIENGRIVEKDKSANILTNPRSITGQKLVHAARLREGSSIFETLDSPTVLEVNSLRCWHSLGGWPWGEKWLQAVNDLSFSLRAGESLGVVGASGCGKSTLCRALMGLIPIRGGEVRLRGQNLCLLSGKPLRIARQSLQMVFQDPLACLNPKMKVVEAIMDPLLIHDLCSPRQAREKANWLLQQVGLSPPENYQNRFPNELSGGQQQRVAIARSLALTPQVLICDESVSMLDSDIQSEVLTLLKSLQVRLGLAILFITHDLSVASGFCHKIIVLEDGRIVEEGPGDRIFLKPKAAMTRKLVESSLRLPVKGE